MPLLTAKNLSDWVIGTPFQSLAKAKSVLVFGADEGGVNALAHDIAICHGSPDKIDASQVSLPDIQSRLNTGGLFGPAAPLRITNATDKHATVFESILEQNLDGFMIVDAGALKGNSKLKSLFEKQATAVQLYPLTPAESASTLRSVIKSLGFECDDGALRQYTPALSSDRLILRRIAEVIVLSAMGRGSRKVEGVDIGDIISDSSDMELCAALDSALIGNLSKSLSILDRQLASGENIIALSRIWAWRLQKIRDLAKTGKSPSDAVSSAKPPIFWKDKAFFEKSISKLGMNGSNALLVDLDRMEFLSIEKGMPSRILAERFLVKAYKQKSS